MRVSNKTNLIREADFADDLDSLFASVRQMKSGDFLGQFMDRKGSKRKVQLPGIELGNFQNVVNDVSSTLSGFAVADSCAITAS